MGAIAGGNGPAATKYTHVHPALQTLTGDALDLWGDGAIREQALRDVLNAILAGDAAARARAVARVDGAVVSGLDVLGYPRGPVRSVDVEPLPSGYGVKGPNCDVRIDTRWLDDSLNL